MTRYAFESFELDTDTVELRREGRAVPIEPKPFRLLCYLIVNRHRVVTIPELGESVWEISYVSTNAVARAIRQVRRALMVEARDDPFLRTVPRYGYQWRCPCTVVDAWAGARRDPRPGLDTTYEAQKIRRRSV